MRSKSMESNVASVLGTNARSALATMIHLVETRSSEAAVVGFLQKTSTSLVKVMMYSQIACADSVDNARVHPHINLTEYCHLPEKTYTRLVFNVLRSKVSTGARSCEEDYVQL